MIARHHPLAIARAARGKRRVFSAKPVKDSATSPWRSWNVGIVTPSRERLSLGNAKWQPTDTRDQNETHSPISVFRFDCAHSFPTRADCFRCQPGRNRPGDNGGANQLRAKLAAAQSSGGGTLLFNVGTATISLSSALPVIQTNVTIDGAGKVTLSGNNAVRLLSVDLLGVLTLKNIVLEKGYSGNDYGGAIYNLGRLFLDHTTIQHSYSPLRGGGIYTTRPLDITNSTLAFQIAGTGGAIYADGNDAKVKISGSFCTTTT